MEQFINELVIPFTKKLATAYLLALKYLPNDFELNYYICIFISAFSGAIIAKTTKHHKRPILITHLAIITTIMSAFLFSIITNRLLIIYESNDVVATPFPFFRENFDKYDINTDYYNKTPAFAYNNFINSNYYTGKCITILTHILCLYIHLTSLTFIIFYTFLHINDRSKT